MTNTEIAQKLRDHAGRLSSAGDNLYRVRAFRQAALAVMAADREAAEVIGEAGRVGLRKVFGVGESVSDAIYRYVETGEWTAN